MNNDNINQNITISYTLADGMSIQVSVPIGVAQVLEETDRNLRSQGRKDRRYRYFSEYTDGEIEFAADFCQDSVSDIVDKLETNAQLHKAISMLSETQQRRLKAYFFEGLNTYEIAAKEGIRHQAVSAGIRLALKNLKKILKTLC